MSLSKLLGLLAIVVALCILWQVRQTLLLIFAAVVMAIALNRLVRLLQQWGIQRLCGTLLSIGLLVTLVAGFFWLVVPSFAEQFQQLIWLLPQALRQLNDAVDSSIEALPDWINNSLPDIDHLTREIQPLGNRLLSEFFNVFSSSLAILLRFLLVLVLTAMLLADPKPYRRAFIQLFPSFYRRRADHILDRCETALGSWLVGILVSMFAVTGLSWVGLMILRVDLALAHGMLAGVLTFIPNIGPVLSVVPPTAIALLDSPWKAIAVVTLYVLIQQLKSNLLIPLAMDSQASLLPAVILVAQITFASFFGFLGLLLAFPLTVIGQVWLKEVLVKDILEPHNRKHLSKTTAIYPKSSLSQDKNQTLLRSNSPDNGSNQNSNPASNHNLESGSSSTSSEV